MLYRAERLAWVIAWTLISGCAFVGVVDGIAQHRRLAAFNTAMEQQARLLADSERALSALAIGPPDRSDWSAAVARNYEQQRSTYAALPQAVLRIPAIAIEAEIFDNTDRRSLDLGVGRISGTATPGGPGNVGLAGHRDGYFRRLKNLKPGQTIQIFTRNGRWDYEVERIQVVDPSEVGVLAPTSRPSVTLVTCYPFYFLGSAPWRYVVQAHLISQEIASPHGNTRT